LISCLLSSVVLATVFFFSSRRRHTRFSRDWSSDVCSSDLENGRCCGGAGAYLVEQPGIADALGSAKAEIVRETRPDIVVTSNTRSEERRVGKECRARWTPNHDKKRK